MHRYRSHTCGQLREADAGNETRLAGWCHRIRDHGGVLFVDLRDHYGITQCVVDPDSSAFELAETLRSEWVVRVDGKVRIRPAGTHNDEMTTGKIEVYVTAIEVLGPAAELPLPVAGAQNYPEDIRLKYRFLDLRRDKLHANIMLRGRVIDSMRGRMKEQGFFEFQTPILTASSPEGARDYLVPSRVHPGKFYALPQAPQQFKQLLMVAGFDRYFQIAPCFRDEDARADRSPGEFYQLDIEMSFVTQEDVFAAVEPVLRGLFEEYGGGKPVTQSFPMISFSAAVKAFGSDKPDLRNPLLIHDVTAAFAGSGFGVFAKRIAADPETRVWAIPAPKGGSRTFCDRMDAWAKGEGQPGLAYIFWREGEALGAGPVAKNIGLERSEAIRLALNGQSGEWAVLPTPEADQAAERFPAEIAAPYRALRPEGLTTGDAVFFVLGRPDAMYKFAGLARQRLGTELGLATTGSFEFCWIVDFPMYEWNEDDKKIDFSHNPFSMPQMEHDAFLALDAADETPSARSQGLPVRHRLQRRGAVLGSDPEPSSRHDAQGFRAGRLRRERARGALRRHVPGLPVRRPAARRHRARRGPHRHASRRRGEPARDRALPDEPARRGPSHGCAQRGDGEAAARAAHPAGRAGGQESGGGRAAGRGEGRELRLRLCEAWP